MTDLAPINPVAASLDKAAAVLDAHADRRASLDTVLDLVDGFETPYSFELLATVHFAAVQPPPTDDLGELTRRVTSWSLRKVSRTRMFDSQLSALLIADS